MRVAESAERLVYRVAGLPVALGVLFGGYEAEANDPLRSAFAHRYWHPDGLGEWSELLGGIMLWPMEWPTSDAKIAARLSLLMNLLCIVV